MVEFQELLDIKMFNKTSNKDSHSIVIENILGEIRDRRLLDEEDEEISLVGEPTHTDLEGMEIEYEKLLDVESEIYFFSMLLSVLLFLCAFTILGSIYSVFIMLSVVLLVFGGLKINNIIFRIGSNVVSFFTSKNCYKSMKKIENTIGDMRRDGYIDNIEKNLIVAQDLMSTPQIDSRVEKNKVFLEQVKKHIINVQTAGEDDKKRIRNMFYLNRCNKKLNGLLEDFAFYGDRKKAKKTKKERIVSNVKLL